MLLGLDLLLLHNLMCCASETMQVVRALVWIAVAAVIFLHLIQLTDYIHSSKAFRVHTTEAFGPLVCKPAGMGTRHSQVPLALSVCPSSPYPSAWPCSGGLIANKSTFGGLPSPLPAAQRHVIF